MSESVYFVHAEQPSADLAKIHNMLAEHLHKRGLSVIEPAPWDFGSNQLSEQQRAEIARSIAVIAELSEVDDSVRRPIEQALRIGRPVLALFNRYAAVASEPAVDLSDLLITDSLRCDRPFAALAKADLFLKVHTGYVRPLASDHVTS
jgi:hypothetical protein